MPGSMQVGLNDPIIRVSTVASSGTDGSVVEKPSGYALNGFVIPAGFTGTTLRIQVSVDNETFVTLKDNVGVDVILTTSASSGTNIDVNFGMCWRYIKPIVEEQLSEVSVTLVFV